MTLPFASSSSIPLLSTPSLAQFKIHGFSSIVLRALTYSVPSLSLPPTLEQNPE